ncbi:MAG: sterol desaturase family protein [Nannocystales bacterium]
MNPVALAIPAFLLLIAVEALIGRVRGRRVYRFNDTVANLGIGISNQVLSSLFTEALRTAAYVWIYLECRVWDFETLGIPTALQWALGFLGVDFLFYWWHRANHRVGLLWAAHVVHHHGEDFNLAVALRQPWIIRTTALPLFLLLGVAGVPPHIYLMSIALSSLYQFWIHTELVGRLGPLEWVLNTPSHHRVHHAINPEYLDRNYGGVFIVWDRAFGTFAAERSQPVYGTIAQVRSFNPLWLNVYYFAELARRSWSLPLWRDKLRLWFAPPGWTLEAPAPTLSAEQIRSRAAHKYSEDCTGSRVKAYVFVQLLVSVGVVATLLLSFEELSAGVVGLAGSWVLLATIVWGGLFEGKRWAWPLEVARVLAAAGVLLMR